MHTVHTQSDRRAPSELWDSCCVFIAWTSVSMDSCIPFAFAYLIPLMLPSYTRRRPPLPRFTVSLYIWDYVEFDKLINMLYRNRTLLLFFFFFFFLLFLFCSVLLRFSAQSPQSGEEHMHSAWPSCTISNNVMLFCYQMKMFYLWSLRHIIVVILSHDVCFSTSKSKVFLFSLCLFVCPCKKILLHRHSLFRLCYVLALLHLPSTRSSKMPHKSKGSSSWYPVSSITVGHTAMWKVCLLIFFSLNESSSVMLEPGGGEGDTRGSPRIEVAFSQQHRQLKGRKSSGSC